MLRCRRTSSFLRHARGGYSPPLSRIHWGLIIIYTKPYCVYLRGATGLGCRVEDLGFGVQGIECRFWAQRTESTGRTSDSVGYSAGLV